MVNDIILVAQPAAEESLQQDIPENDIEPFVLDGGGEYEIRSIEDLLVLLNRLYAAEEKILWFRGQASYEWDLSPGFFRLNGNVSESTLLMKFKQSASQLIMGTPKESFDWMFLMQHYGLPTRLLDWSESPLVGLYFAVENTHRYGEDGALWIINPMKLNLLSRIQSENEE
ncbi:FRG domain-containing protein [Edaphovirga cremea]|uniref:FRG domain-containing protein n=1 Tax=Edaphovirga cremea TaxID=2267246 RepID=UPI0039895F09